ncbi:hypothetical protein [Bacillus cereus]|uniref:hypothetical protein n=1 Tax=Bacillus cereus TaxID=1396 RepID=UPI003D64B844
MSKDNKPMKVEITVDSLERIETVNPILKDIADRVREQRTGFDFGLSFSLHVS